jgi:hypothetical protein
MSETVNIRAGGRTLLVACQQVYLDYSKDCDYILSTSAFQAIFTSMHEQLFMIYRLPI